MNAYEGELLGQITHRVLIRQGEEERLANRVLSNRIGSKTRWAKSLLLFPFQVN